MARIEVALMIQKGEDVEHLWERVLFLASLWVSTFAEFRECSVSKILLDAVL